MSLELSLTGSPQSLLSACGWPRSRQSKIVLGHVFHSVRVSGVDVDERLCQKPSRSPGSPRRSAVDHEGLVRGLVLLVGQDSIAV